MFCQVEGYLFDNIAYADAAPEVRGGTQGVLVVDSEEVQVHIQQQGSRVLRIDLQLLHRLDVTTVYIEQLIVYHATKKFSIQRCLFDSLRDHLSYRVPGRQPLLSDVYDGLLPPLQACLAYGGLPRDLPGPQGLQEQGMHSVIVGLDACWEALPRYIGVEIELPALINK